MLVVLTAMEKTVLQNSSVQMTGHNKGYKAKYYNENLSKKCIVKLITSYQQSSAGSVGVQA
jgi:hypothetical protein